MTTYRSVPLPAGFAYDTAWKLTAGEAGVLRRAPPPVGLGEPTTLWRYVSLGDPQPADITPAERDAIFAGGWEGLGLVQHVERPSWQADPASGLAHGAAAVKHAQLVGYPAGACLALDMEGLGDADAPVMGYVVAWASVVHAAGYRVLCYVGYATGLDAALYSLLASGGHVDAWWSDFGARTLPDPLRFAMKQHAQVRVAGIDVDPDEVLVAGAVTVMGIDDGDPLPHYDPSDTRAATIPVPDTAHGDTMPPEAA